MSDATSILYVEDNPDNRKLVSRLLSAYGYDVQLCIDGYAGLDYAKEHTPALILVDIGMPGMDGYEVTGQLRQMSHLDDTPIIALTANVLKGAREESLAAGCDGYISKPINIDTFPEQIASFLG